MKTRLLLLAIVLIGMASAASAQTYRVDWKEADSAVGTAPVSMKRNGTLVDLNGTEKRLLFRYDISNLVPGHTAAMCWELCFFLWPGEDDPTLREPQILPANGTSKIYTLLNTSADQNGVSSFSITFYDAVNTADSLRVVNTFLIGGVSSVPELSTLGLTAGPLPAVDVFTVSGDVANTVIGADLYSSSGTLMHTYGVTSGSQHTFSVGHLASGTYHMVLTTTNGGVVRTPVVIAR